MIIKNYKRIALINISVLFLIFISLEIASGYLLSVRQKKTSLLVYVIKKLNVKDRTTPKLEKLKALKKEGLNNIYPHYLYDPQVHPLDSQKYWFSNVPNANILLCKEGSGWITFGTNRLGFRKVLNQNLNLPIKVITIGDSYTHGACVANPNEIASQLSILRDENILNAGFGGSGPLFQLALFKEILSFEKQNGLIFDKDAKLVWTIFTGNDLKNLAEEKVTLLSRYFENDFNSKYFSNLTKLAPDYKKFLDKVISNFSKNNNISSHGYGETVLPYSISEQTNLKDFERVFDEFVKISDRNNIDLNVVILSDHPRYDIRINNVTKGKIKSLCNKNNSKCLFISLKEIRKDDSINHLYEDEYKKVSILINEFLDN